MTARRCAKLSNEGNTEKHEGGQEVFVWDKPNVWKISRFRVAAVDLASPVLCRWLVWTTKKGVSSAICEMGRLATMKNTVESCKRRDGGKAETRICR